MFLVLGEAIYIRLAGILAKLIKPSTIASHILPAPIIPILAVSRSITLAPFLRDVELFFFNFVSDLETTFESADEPTTLAADCGAPSVLLATALPAAIMIKCDFLIKFFFHSKTYIE